MGALRFYPVLGRGCPLPGGLRGRGIYFRGSKTRSEFSADRRTSWPRDLRAFQTLPQGHPPTVFAGTSSVDLEAFAGTFFVLDEQSVDIPDTAGPNILYAGIDLNGNVTLDAPYNVTDGALLTFNSAFEDTFCTNYSDSEPLPTEHSGPDIPTPLKQTYSANVSNIPASWLNPPPLNPNDMGPIKQWQRAMFKRLAK
jgi:hypothetical protein